MGILSKRIRLFWTSCGLNPDFFIHAHAVYLIITPPTARQHWWSVALCMKRVDKNMILLTGSKQCLFINTALYMVENPFFFIFHVGFFSSRQDKTAGGHVICMKGSEESKTETEIIIVPFQPTQYSVYMETRFQGYTTALAFSFKLAFGHRSHYRNMHNITTCLTQRMKAIH